MQPEIGPASPEEIAARIADRIGALSEGPARNLIAIAGPPASGKSTVARALQAEYERRGIRAGLVAMDGFHLDNPILDARGLRARKGAPETFDLGGFRALLRRLTEEGEVVAPSFDRERDVSVGSSVVVEPEMRVVVVEGNYVLLDEPGWRDLRDLWTYSVMLTLDEAVLKERLIERWHNYGFNDAEARKKALMNDLPNAERIMRHRLEADLTMES